MNTTQVIDELAKRFGATGEYLVKEIARYNITMDIVGIIISAFAIIGSVIGFKIMQVKIKNGEWYEDDWKVLIFSIVGVIAIVIDGVIFVLCSVDCIGWIVSPMAAAIGYITR